MHQRNSNDASYSCFTFFSIHVSVLCRPKTSNGEIGHFLPLSMGFVETPYLTMGFVETPYLIFESRLKKRAIFNPPTRNLFEYSLYVHRIQWPLLFLFFCNHFLDTTDFICNNII